MIMQKPQLKEGQIWALDVGANAKVISVGWPDGQPVVTCLAISKYSKHLIHIRLDKSVVNPVKLITDKHILKDFLTKREIIKYLLIYNLMWRWRLNVKPK